MYLEVDIAYIHVRQYNYNRTIRYTEELSRIYDM